MKYDIRKTSQFKKDFEMVVKRGLILMNLELFLNY